MSEWWGKHWSRRRAVGVTACVLAILVTGVAVRATQSPDASQRVALAARDTAVASHVGWGTELERLLAAVAAVTSTGLGEAERKRILDDVQAVARSGPFTRDRSRLTSYDLEVRFRGQQSRVALAIRAVDIGYVDVQFSAADTALIGAIRAAIRAVHLASLGPLGRARLVIEERPGWKGRRPAITLALTTEKEFSCLGYGIETRLERRGDTLAFHVDGVTPPPGSVCPAAMGPAVMESSLDVAPGHYVLMVDYRGDTNDFALAVTDSSVALAPRRATFLSGDRRLRWRVPRNSFVLRCHPGGPSGAMCEDLHRWVARQPGIERVVLGDAGLSPYPDDAPDYSTRIYRYASEGALRAVRSCVVSISPQVREAVGMWLTLETWTGEEARVQTMRSVDESHIGRPASVTQSRECRAGA